MANLLRKGSRGDEVTQLQNMLNSYGNYGLTVDGIYGDNTANAVRQYQLANGLSVDGIVGDQTWSALNAAQTAADSTNPDGTATTLTTAYGATYNPSETTANAADLNKAEGGAPTFQQSQALSDALNRLTEMQNGKPGEYTSPYSDQIAALYEQATKARNPFSYDPNADPLYQMYRDRYTQYARQSMNDTLADAAALTGGYGNSYAQAAAQQAYDSQMNGLNDALPELYNQAYNEWLNQGDETLQRLALAQQMDETAYGRYADNLNDYYNQLSAQMQLANQLYGQEYGEYQDRPGWSTVASEFENIKNQMSGIKTLATQVLPAAWNTARDAAMGNAQWNYSGLVDAVRQLNPENSTLENMAIVAGLGKDAAAQLVNGFANRLNLTGDNGAYIHGQARDMLRQAEGERLGDAANRTIGQWIKDTFGADVDLNPTAQWIYQSLASGVMDSAVNGAIFGGAGSVTMGIGAMTDTMREVKEEGGTNLQALMMGTISGGLEIFTEGKTFEHVTDLIGKPANVVKDEIMRDFAKSLISEGVEEMASEIGNMVADYFIMADKGDFRQSVQEYMKQGYDESGAMAATIKDGVGQVLLAGAGGMFGALFTSGGAVALNRITAHVAKNDVAKMSKSYTADAAELFKNGYGNSNMTPAQYQAAFDALYRAGVEEIPLERVAASAPYVLEVFDDEQADEIYRQGVMDGMQGDAEESGQRGDSTPQSPAATAPQGRSGATTSPSEPQVSPGVPSGSQEAADGRSLSGGHSTQESEQRGDSTPQSPAATAPLSGGHATQGVEADKAVTAMTEAERREYISSLRKSGLKTGLVRDYDTSAVKLNRTQRTQLRVIDQIGREYGYEIHAVETLGGDNAWTDPESRRTTFALDAVDQAYTQVVGHELVHNVKALDADGYRVMQGYVLQYLTGNGYDLEGNISQRAENYQKQGVTLSREQAIEEIVAESYGTVFSDENAVYELVKEDRRLGERILDFLKEIVGRIRGTIEKYANSQNREEMKLLMGQAETLQDMGQLFSMALERANENGAREMAAREADENAAKFSVKEMPDGRKYVQVDVDQSQFDGKTEVELRKLVKRLIMDKYRPSMTTAHGEITVTKASAGEYARSRSRVSGEEYEAKARVSAELQNLIDVSEYEGYEDDGAQGHYHEGVRGYSYYTTLFEVNGQYYKGRINIEERVDGERRLKDVTRIENVTGAATRHTRSAVEQPTQISDDNARDSDSVARDGEGVKQQNTPTDTQGDEQRGDAPPQSAARTAPPEGEHSNQEGEQPWKGRLDRANGVFRKYGRAKLTRDQRVTLRGLDEVCQRFGLRLNVVEALPMGLEMLGDGDGAFTMSLKGVEHGAANVFAHGLMAWLKGENPESYRQVEAWALREMNELEDEYQAQYGAEDSPLDLNREADKLAAALQAEGLTAEASVEAAYDQLVADAAAAAMSSESAMRHLVDENRSLAAKIKGWLTQFVNGVRAALMNYADREERSHVVALMLEDERLERIGAALEKALDETASNEAVAQGNNDTGVIRYSAREANQKESKLKEQIRNVAAELAKMEPLAYIDTESSAGLTKEELRQAALKKAEQGEGTVEREGFAVVQTNQKRIANGLSYAESRADYLVVDAIPAIIKYGLEAERHDNHKNRGYSTVTFAGRVMIDGKPGNMAVVVRRTTDYFYKTHKVLTPDGKVFVLEYENAADEGIQTGKGGANPAIIDQRTTSADGEIVSQNGESVNDVTQLKNVTQDTHAQYGENPQVGFLSDRSMIAQDGEDVNVQFSLREDAEGDPDSREMLLQAAGYGGEARTYSYEEMAAKPDMPLTRIERNVDIGKSAVKDAAFSDLLRNGARALEDGRLMMRVEDIGKDVIVTGNALMHSYFGRNQKELAPVLNHIGGILKNAIAINEQDSRNEGIAQTWHLIGAAVDDAGQTHMVRITVDQSTNEVTDVAHIHAVSAKESGTFRHQSGAGYKANSPVDQYGSAKLSIAELMGIVKDYAPDIISRDVAAHYGMERGHSAYEGILRYSLPEKAQDMKALNAVTKEMNKAHRRVNALAREMIREVKSGYDQAELAGNITKLMDEIALKGVSDTTTQEAAKLARDVVDQARLEAQEALRDERRAVLASLRGRSFHLDETERADAKHIADSYTKFVKSVRRTFDIRSSAGASLDEIWSELHSEWPGYFPSSEDTTLSKLRVLLQVDGMLHPAKGGVYEAWGYDAETVAVDMGLRLEQNILTALAGAATAANSQGEGLAAVKADAKAQRDLAQAAQDEAQTMRALAEAWKQRAAELGEQRDALKANFKQQMRNEIAALKAEQRKRFDEIAATLRAARDAGDSETQARMMDEYRAQMRRLGLQEQEALARLGYRRSYETHARMSAAWTRIEKNARNLRDTLAKPDKNRHVPRELQVPVMQMLDALDFRRGGRDTKDTTAWQDSLRAVRDMLARQLARQQGALSDTDDTAGVWMSLCEPQLDRFSEAVDAVTQVKKPISQMTLEEINALSNALATVQHVINSINETWTNERHTSIDALGAATADELGRMKTNRAQTGIFKGLDNMLNVEQLDARSFFERLGGEKSAAMSVYEELRQGQDRAYEKVREASEEVPALLGLDGKDTRQRVKTIRGWAEEKHTFDFAVAVGNGIKTRQVTMTGTQLMELYALSKRQQARMHLLTGGFMVNYTKNGDNATYKLDENTLERMVNELTDDQKQTVDRLQGYLSGTVSGWGNEVTRRMYLFDMFGEENYWPIHSERDYMRTREADGQMLFNALTNAGFAKKTQDQVRNPIIIGE